jgi:hypothetical protein
MRRVRVPVEGGAVFAKLRTREELVELILADDFLDFMQIGNVPQGMSRASRFTCKREGDRRGSNLRPSLEPQSAEACFQALPYVAESA